MEKTLPEKVYYRIGEVAAYTGLKSSVLRFWESEFEFLKPVKSRSGQRLYSRNDLELIIEIKRLLYTEKYTLEGVRKRLSTRGRERKDEKGGLAEYRALLKEIKTDLLKIRNSI